MPELDPDIRAHYELGVERERLATDTGPLEAARTRELLARHLPPPPASVLDVGGGTGAHAGWLAEQGYAVHLVDPVPLHVDQAAADARFTAALGDARSLREADASVDAVLLLGPLYHLTEAEERVLAWREALRVVRPGGVVAGAAISRFAPVLDGLRRGLLPDPSFREMMERDLGEGQHRNPTGDPVRFTTAYFHRPDELGPEAEAAGLAVTAVNGIEGPGWLLADLGERWRDPGRREEVMTAARAVESEPSLLGLSPHLLAVCERPG